MHSLRLGGSFFMEGGNPWILGCASSRGLEAGAEPKRLRSRRSALRASLCPREPVASSAVGILLPF